MSDTALWVGLACAAMLSLVLFIGPYLRHRREQERGTVIHPLKIYESDKGKTGFAYSAQSMEALLAFIDAYNAEVTRIAVGYHQRMMLEGSEAALDWLESQTGKRPSPPDRERR